MAEYKLPDVGEGLTEADIVTWRVAVGDTVAINDIVVEIETAKSLVELPSPYAGVVRALLVPEGQTVNVGTPIIDIAETSRNPAEGSRGSAEESRNPVEGSRGSAEESRNPVEGSRGSAEESRNPVEGSRGSAEESRNPVEESKRVANLVGYGPREAAVHRRERRTPTGTATAASDRVLAKPPTRLLARELGVDLSTVTADERGVVTSEAVAAVGTSSEPAAPATKTSDVDGGNTGRERREPIKGVRKAMASAMVSSAFSAPHVATWVSVDVTPTMELVEELKSSDAFAGVRVSPLLILARACIVAMRRTPAINSVWNEDSGQVIFKRYVNLGLAAATPRGLVVPNIKDAQDLTLAELGAAINTLADTAREGRTSPADMSGGTFTITNVGVFGVDGGTPIINPGESAILAFGAVNKRPWVVSSDGGDALAIRQVTTLSLSFDHRHVDGAMGCQFLSDVAGLLAEPEGLLD